MNPRGRANPFPGLRPFMQAEADLFFGRDRQCDELVRRLGVRRFLAVVGTSGSGKSSLVRAGLLPSLEGGLMAGAGTHWRMAIMRPQDDPIGFLARAIVETGALAHLGMLQPAAEGVVETILRRSSLGMVEAVRLAGFEPHENLLVLVDQFEELFRFANLATERDAGNEAPAFVKLLLAAARQTDVPIYIVITMRSDFLGDCARFRDLPEAINDSQYLIPRLTRDELQAVIGGPIGVRGGRIAPGLLQRLLNDVGDDIDQLPVLQHALMRAWDHWERSDHETRPINLDDLEAIGGMGDALSRHADETFNELMSDRERTHCARLFKALTERGTDNREIRRPTSLGRLTAIVNADVADVVRVVEAFRAPGRSFLMPPHGVPLDDGAVVDISHESLIRQWGRLRSWVEEEAESRATYLRIVEAARLRLAGRAGLWGEPDLTYARQWQAREAPNAAWSQRYGPGFDDACTFLRESENFHAAVIASEAERAAAERIAKERELEQARALAEAQRQRADEQAAARARQRRLSWALAALFALAAGAAIYGWQQRRVADEKRREAESQSALALSRQIAVQANSESDRGLQLALLFGAAAHHAASTGEARQLLQRALEAQPHLRTFLSGHGDAVHTVAFSPDGQTLASAGEDRTVILWDTKRRAPLGPALKGHQGRVTSVAFSPDGKMLATAGVDEAVILWDVASRTPVGPALKKHRSWVNSVAFSPDGKTLASGGEDRMVILWDVASRSPKGDPLEGHRGGVRCVAFSPDGRMLASSGMEESVRVWDLSAGKPTGQPLEGHQDAVLSVAFSPDGKTLASASGETVILWDVSGRKPRGEPLKGHAGLVWSVAFSPNGKTLASSSADKAVILWDMTTTRPRVESLEAHQGAVRSVVFSPDGQTLASASTDESVILWDVANRQPLSQRLTRPAEWANDEGVRSVAFSPDGQTLASAGDDRTVVLWGMASRQPLGAPLQGHLLPVTSVAFSPDGRTLVSASEDKTVLLWDVSTRKTVGAPLKGHRLAVTSVAFSPDGRTLASASEDQTVNLWSVASGTPLGEPLRGHKGTVNSVAFSPNGQTLASGSADRTVIVWDVASRKPLGDPLEGHTEGVNSVAFSPDGETLAAASAGMIFWQVASRAQLGEPIRDSPVGSVAFSPDGKTLAASARDYTTMTMWDIASRKQRGEPFKTASSSSVAFSPDGRTLAAGGLGGVLILWDVDVDSWRRKACAIANRNWTHKEWAEYVGEDVPYRAPCPELPVPVE